MNKRLSGLEQLESLANDESLKVDGWDSYGAKALQPTIKEKVGEVLSMLDLAGSSAQVVPTNTGGFQLEWNYGDSGVEVEFSPSEEGINATIYQEVNGEMRLERTVNADSINVDEIRGLLAEVMPASS